MPPLRFAADFSVGEGFIPPFAAGKRPAWRQAGLWFPGRFPAALREKDIPAGRYRRGYLWICQAIRTADTTRRPLPPPWVYSQVDRVMSLSPYLGVMPVS